MKEKKIKEKARAEGQEERIPRILYEKVETVINNLKRRKAEDLIKLLMNR